MITTKEKNDCRGANYVRNDTVETPVSNAKKTPVRNVARPIALWSAETTENTSYLTNRRRKKYPSYRAAKTRAAAPTRAPTEATARDEAALVLVLVEAERVPVAVPVLMPPPAPVRVVERVIEPLELERETVASGALAKREADS